MNPNPFVGLNHLTVPFTPSAATKRHTFLLFTTRRAPRLTQRSPVAVSRTLTGRAQFFQGTVAKFVREIFFFFLARVLSSFSSPGRPPPPPKRKLPGAFLFALQKSISGWAKVFENNATKKQTRVST